MARFLRQRRQLAMAAFFALGLLVIGAQSATGGPTFLVDDNKVECPLAPYTTIQDAVDAASPGDIIQVCAGTYPEPAPGPLSIYKQLTVLGAQSGADARTRGGAESIITDPQGTSVSASNVIIDGFTVQDSVVAAFTGFGIWLNPGIGGTEIVNNIIQDNIVGIGLANNGAEAVIRHNLIRNNILPGSASGSGIYTDESVGGPTVRNVLIDENDFIGHSGFGGAINISNTDFANGGVFTLLVTDNVFDANSRAFVLFNTHNSAFEGNTITNSTFVGSADVRLFDNNSNLTFTNNNLRGGAGHAIRFTSLPGSPSSNVVFHENNIEVYVLTGLTVDPLSHVGTVNAECNWWNSPSGPFNVPNNPTGTGEEVVGDADFTPWLTARAPGGPCFGVPSTPGKVTGGGQVQGDPLFSPAGELLSVPALIPSLSGSNTKATFGFVVKCCPETGNLQYQDHGADVRIKALSFDRLIISAPGTACPLTPGSKHATIHGSAQVIRPSGTTTESITVEVDDCGEPGVNDTFGIQAGSYDNPPSTLIGGNIQIH